METDTNLLIIGAGPFGLALAAQAKHLGLDHLVVGKPMEFWRQNMPKGMYLRSASDWHLDPVGEDTIDRFLKTQAITPAESEPLSLETYLRYAQWFQDQKRTESLPTYITRLDRSAQSARFQATSEDGDLISANQVVVAVGFKYFKNLPSELARHLPAGRLTHTCDHVDFTDLRGKRCLIIGGRQSAFEWAALIHEAGAAAVHVCHRHDSPAFAASDWSWVDPLVDSTAADPGWYRNLPAARKEELTQRLWAEGRLKVEPWLEPRMRSETIKLWPRTQVVGCTARTGGELWIELDNGETILVDHVIAATGYKVDLDRVPFLSEGNLRGNIATRSGFPILDERFQTNIPGLFVTSMAAAQEFGPFWGFTTAVRTSAKIIGAAIVDRQARTRS